MRWIRGIVAAAALLTVTACGEQTAATGSGSAEAGGPPPASKELSRSPEEVPGGGPVPKGQIDASALPDGHPVDVAVDEGGRTLTIVAQEGGCTRASATVAEQTAQRVEVTLVESQPADKNTMCTMDMRYPPLTVDLDEPLGKRVVVLEHKRDTH
ncbi:hypothetical protein AB8O38_12725 [Saccharomonospora xinjiangensis]|uniref:hypothetical protein n=1 Tax=Saccharomonospora xinjiangensis TaxID=75294 RepID=UPI0035105487